MMHAKLRRNWQYSTSVVAPVVLSVLLVMAGVLGLVFWSATSNDERALERETALVARLITGQLLTLAHDQESVTTSNAAVINTRLVLNPTWIDSQLGQWMHTYFGHDRTFVLGGDDTPVYAMNEGTRASLSLYEKDRPAYDAIVHSLRMLMATPDLAKYYAGKRAHPPQVTDIMVISGKPAIVSAIPIVTQSEALEQQPGTEFIHLSVMFLAEDFARDIERRYMLRNASFSLAASNGAGHAAFPLMNNAGRLVGFFEWQPDTPGKRTLAEILPVLAIAFLIGGIALLLMATKLWRSSQAVRAGHLKAQHMANHDALTGLPNRAFFEQTLEQAIPETSSIGGPLALFMLDLDRFKQVNDTRGHDAGDELIRAVARRMLDLVDDGQFIARIGGDEFAVICKNCSGEADALRRAHKAIDSLGRPYTIFGGEVFIGVSVGIILTTDPTAQRHELVRKADIALYEAKADGRNCAIVYAEQMNELLQLRHTVEGELREALKAGDQLSVSFQPLFDAQSRITGAEALARWQHPKFGSISPAQFIPVAESAGLIEAVGESVLQRACEMGARFPGRTIAVNISPVQLRNPKFQARIFELLRETGMRAADLELEITEGILLEDTAVAIETLHSFRAAGIKIALDDFGTGYSSLNYLKRYAVDRVKIDRSFVSQLGEDKTSFAIVEAMITLAHAMGIEVTAEGVETRSQFQMLRDMRCNTFQGYLMSAPISPEEVANLFAEQPRLRMVGA
jgi:diguanylate cyclase (GGDEF)-like protein